MDEVFTIMFFILISIFLMFILIICFRQKIIYDKLINVMIYNETEEKVDEYDPLDMVNKEFIYEGSLYHILQYSVFDNTDSGRRFLCFCLDTRQSSTWYEDELKLAIAKNDVWMVA